MNFRRRMLSRVREGDRMAVLMLRGAEMVGTAEMRRDFDVFREKLFNIGLQILEPDAVIFGEDERDVLGWLAAIQRKRVELAIESWRMATAEAQLCAEHLNRLGYRIDYHRAMTAQGTNFSARLAEAGWEDVSSQPPTSDGRRAVLQALRERGPMRTVELTALGISRQALSVMVRNNLIRRLRYGVYALPAKTKE